MCEIDDVRRIRCLESGDQHSALGNVDAQRFFAINPFAGRYRLLAILFVPKRRAGDVYPSDLGDYRLRRGFVGDCGELVGG